MASIATTTLIEELQGIVGTQAVLTDEPMAQHTTFKIGGPADVLVMPGTFEQAADVIKACKRAGIPYRFLGLGSNILASDAGIRGVVIKFAENLSLVSVRGTTLVAEAGASNEKVAATAQAAGLAGYEFASGIPGTIGGAAIMNAGAYGGEFKDVATSLVCLTPDAELVTVSAEEADWSYRHSMMMDKGYLVLEATLQLNPDSKEAIQERMDDLRQRREEKQPLEMPSAGSTFKRPEGYFAGKLIQDAGLKGYTVGGAQVSTKHSGFVVNAGNATAADVLQLIQDVHDRIFAMEGVHMEPEVRMWGFDD